jgi:two-component system sensor histidine kinase ChvG
MASAIVVAEGAVANALRHLARIRYRLLLVNAIVAVVPIVGIAFAEMHETQLLANLESNMTSQASLVRAAVLASPPRRAVTHEAMLATAARDTRTRIRLLDASGAVIADSHRGAPAEPIALVDRREIRQALAGRYGSATRLWGTQSSHVYLFAALPIVRDGRVEGAVYVTRSTYEVKLQLERLRRWLVRVMIANVALTALVSLLLATTIARPLGKLTRRAQRIAARQPVEADRLARRADEIGQLSRAVEAMTDELERRARDARTLAADISHELKNPLAGIRGAAELLRDGAVDDPEARERFLSMIVDDTARLDRIVSRLFELARVEDDRSIALPVDVAALAERTAAARPWPASVEVTAHGESVVYGRAEQLAAAIENLIANATQFADPGSAVRVRIDARAGATRVTASNHGPALSPAAQRRVWDRFYTTRVASGGSGLGLAIVRSVALAHGGSVGVECANGVTSFWFEIRGVRA